MKGVCIVLPDLSEREEEKTASLVHTPKAISQSASKPSFDTPKTPKLFNPDETKEINTLHHLNLVFESSSFPVPHYHHHPGPFSFLNGVSKRSYPWLHIRSSLSRLSRLSLNQEVVAALRKTAALRFSSWFTSPAYNRVWR